VQLQLLAEAKIMLYQMMRAARVNKSQLARRLRIHPPQVDRLIDLRHQSRLEQLGAAFDALNYELSLCIRSRSELGNTQGAESPRPGRAAVTARALARHDA
jgi:antitoxin HicB